MEKDKKGDDIRPIGAAICIGCGVYELMLATSPRGHGWQFAAGLIFVVFGIVRGYYLLTEKKGSDR